MMPKLKKPRSLSLFALITTLALLSMLSQNHTEFSTYEILIFCFYFSIIISIQAAFLYIAENNKAESLSAILAGVFTSGNIYSLILVHDTRFSALPGEGVFGIIAMMAFFLTFLYRLENQSILKFSRTFLVLMLVFSTVQILTGGITVDSLRVVPNHFKIPKFTKHPNVYIISFDTLSPEIIIKKNLNLASVPYDDEIITAEGRIIPNAFAERIPTKASLNAVHAMDMKYFDSFRKTNVMINSKAENPVYKIFRANGYKIQFLYETSYFGVNKGKLDYYGVAKADGLCKHTEKSYALLGYCTPTVRKVFAAVFFEEDRQYPQLLFDRIHDVSKTNEAWLTLAHVYMPGHSKNSFDPYKKEDWEELKLSYKEQADLTAKTLKTLFQTLKENDPQAVLIIFGDHGLLASRSLLNDEKKMNSNALSFNEAELASDSPLSYKQIVQDRHAVLFAVFPKDFCPEAFNHNPYSTVRTMRDMIKCLSNGEDPLPEDFQVDDKKWKPYNYQ
jgi:hypothetical protein